MDFFTVQLGDQSNATVTVTLSSFQNTCYKFAQSLSLVCHEREREILCPENLNSTLRNNKDV